LRDQPDSESGLHETQRLKNTLRREENERT
jgi:hypothetical protein